MLKDDITTEIQTYEKADAEALCTRLALNFDFSMYDEQVRMVTGRYKRFFFLVFGSVKESLSLSHHGVILSLFLSLELSHYFVCIHYVFFFPFFVYVCVCVCVCVCVLTIDVDGQWEDCPVLVEAPTSRARPI